MDTGPSPTDQRISITKAAKKIAENNCTCPCFHGNSYRLQLFWFFTFRPGLT